MYSLCSQVFVNYHYFVHFNTLPLLLHVYTVYRHLVPKNDKNVLKVCQLTELFCIVTTFLFHHICRLVTCAKCVNYFYC